MSFPVDTLNELTEFHTLFKEEGVRIQRTVGHGNAFGMDSLDPEGKTIEVYYRTGFRVPQPYGEAVNLYESEEDLNAIAKAAIPTS